MHLANQLQNFKNLVQQIKSKTFTDFKEFEVEMCNIINKGVCIRNYIVENPQVCNQHTLDFLQNKTKEFSLVQDEFKCLNEILELTRVLLINYDKYFTKLYRNKRYEESIKTLNQMFKLTENYEYKFKMGLIYMYDLRLIEKAYELFKEIEDFLKENIEFCWEYSELYFRLNKPYDCILWAQNAITLERQKRGIE